jgi:hypothetical protein
MINGNTYVGSNIQFAKTTDRTVYMAGRSGVWKSTDLGANWYPAVRNMNVTFNRDVVVNSANNQVYIVDTDWRFLYSTNGAVDVQANTSGISGWPSGKVAAVNNQVTPAKVYLGVGDNHSNTNGALYSTTNPTSGSWVSENLDTAHGATAYNGERVIGLATKNLSGSPATLAAVEGKGLYRKTGSTWSRVNSAVLSSPSTSKAPIVWDHTRTYAYLYDRDSGIYRSSNDGASWSLVYSASTAKVNVLETGYLALDETNNRLYFSKDDGLYVQTSASTSSFGSPTKISSVNIGPIAFNNGKLYAAGLATNIPPYPTADMYTYTYGGSLTSIGDSFYKNNGGQPLSIAVDGAGNIYVGMSGTGVFVGNP